MIDRRAFLRAGLSVAAAPFIVRASSLMALPAPREVLVLGDIWLTQFWPPTGDISTYWVYDGTTWRTVHVA